MSGRNLKMDYNKGGDLNELCTFLNNDLTD